MISETADQRSYRELMSDKCFCGKNKKPEMSFCYNCYKSLPINTQRALYKRIGEGYTEAFEDACLHLQGNSQPVQQVNNDNKFPSDALAHSTDDLVTPRQLVAMKAIANGVGVELEAECQKLLKCDDVRAISRRAASAMIDHLKNYNR